MSDLNSFLSNVSCIAVKIQMQVRGNAAPLKLENPMSVLPCIAAVSAWLKQCLLLQLGTPNKVDPKWIHHANTKGPRSETQGPRIAGSCVNLARFICLDWAQYPPKQNGRHLTGMLSSGNRLSLRLVREYSQQIKLYHWRFPRSEIRKKSRKVKKRQ